MSGISRTGTGAGTGPQSSPRSRTGAGPSRTAQVGQADSQHVFHSWSAQSGPPQLAIESAEGCWLTDYDGQRYFDFSSQLIFTNIGHQHPRVVAAITEQAQRLCTLGPTLTTGIRAEAAAAICEQFGPGHNRVFFTNGGADAVENAIRMARQFTGRRKVLSSYRSYHGNTGAAIAATGDPRRWPNEFASDHAHFLSPFLYRSAFGAETLAQECERALLHLRSVIELEGPATIAAVLLESMIGSAGVIPPPPGYLQGVRDLCDEFGIVYIADEVMVGFGRTGRWFGFELDAPVTPDLVSIAKGVNSGYVPVGAVVISDAIADHFHDRPFPGGLTYSGHPLACASIVANLAVLREERLVEHADDMGNHVLGPGLRQLATRHPCVGEVRGAGMFWALELVADRQSRAELIAAAEPGGAPTTAAAMARLAAAGRSQGLILFTAANRIHLAPPLVASEAELVEALERLDSVIAEADNFAQQ